MTKAVRDASLGGLAGAVLGVLAGRATVVAPPAVPDACPDVEVARRDLEEALERSRQEVLDLRERLVVHVGIAPDWPEDIDPRWEEGPIRKTVERALADGQELLALDCGTYPCVAVVRLPSHDDLDPLLQRIRDAGYEQAEVPVWSALGWFEAAILFAPEQLSRSAWQSATNRADALFTPHDRRSNAPPTAPP
ncbi:MAG: hypothetical protein H6738_10230 [Alphaproteobacteria bacterium]|nr:hypothetical protein [Alphaproteobacteria bacterium]